MHVAAACGDEPVVTHILKKSRTAKEHSVTDGGNVSIDALARLKEKMDSSIVPFLRVIMHPSFGVGLPQFYFCASDRGLDLAFAMDHTRVSSAFLNKEWAFFDGKHDIVEGLVTLGVHVMNPVTGKLDTIAFAHTTSESTRTWKMFWEALNHAMLDRCKRTFNPRGWIPDNAGANFLAIREVFNNGNTMPAREGSGLEHYIMNVSSHRTVTIVATVTLYVHAPLITNTLFCIIAVEPCLQIVEE
jgi:hypothetical protein